MHTPISHSLLSWRRTALCLVALSAITLFAHADPVLVNGSFEQTGEATTSGAQPLKYYGATQTLPGWTVNGYMYLVAPGGGTIGASNGWALWGPATGSNNGLPATSPDGGNYIAMDGAYLTGPLSQQINGLTAGDAVTVSFYWAGAQQDAATGQTTEQLAVSLGDQTDYTAVLTNASKGFTGWESETLTFTPTSTSELLSFLAIGTPEGVPPTVLLDGVSMSPVPEPASLSLIATGLIGVGGMLRKRFKQS